MAISIGYVTVASFPAAYYALHPGLDISWVYGLNHFFNSPFRFGRDLNFTLGPLGFLLYPAALGRDVQVAAFFRLGLALSFFVALGALARDRAFGLALFAMGYGISLAIGQTPEFHLLVVVAVALLAAIERRSLLALISIAALSAALWLAKFSIGIGAMTVVIATAWAWRYLAGGRVSGSVAIVLAHVASLLCGGWLVIGSLGDFVLWFRASLQIAGGYSVAMSLDPGWTDQRTGVAICAVYLAACIGLLRLRRSAALPLLLLAGSMFLAFKAGFVREDAHVKSFFGFAVASLAFPLLTAASAKERMVSGAALLLAGGLAVRAELKRNYLDVRSVANLAAARVGREGIERALRWRDTQASLERSTAQSIVGGRVPDEMRRAIGAGTVVITPWEVVTCLASQLACVPLETLQEYSAYTSYLDFITAAQFVGPMRPDFVLVHRLGGIDGRHVVLDGPLTWRNLLDQYEPVSLHTNDAVLLRRRRVPSDAQAHPLSSVTAHAGEWVALPRTAGFTFAEIKAELSWLGSVVKLLHRIPAAFIELKRASGAIERCRLILETSANGILVQPFAADIADLPHLFEGANGDRVVALRLSGRALRFYKDELEVRWVALPARTTTSTRP